MQGPEAVVAGVFFAGVDGLMLYQWPDLARQSDEAGVRELRRAREQRLYV